jgi:subtilisin family serine protease
MSIGRNRRRLAASLTVALLAGLGAYGWYASTPTAQAAADPVGTAEPAGTAASAPSYTVTLISGDRVRVTPHAGQRPGLRILRGTGRAGMPFVVEYGNGGAVRVVPSDAMAGLAADRLDPRLFDVVLLHRYGYDDAKRDTLPLILAGTAGQLAAAATTGTTVTGTLSALDATVVRQNKASTGALWASLGGGANRAAVTGTGVRKVWLSGRAQLADTVSFPQVGGPAAWQGGYTGKGVTIAVLDGGTDATHPDFAGKIVGSKDFTGSGSPLKDTDGHGTHTASIAAGLGVASAKGKQTGVAKDASLLIGKVCDDDGCPEDAIIAGMDWAVTKKARVVSMSLNDSLTVDYPSPMTAALDGYAGSNTLFVVSAGNVGRDQSVGAPGDANSALTVGSVGPDDKLSSFSSRGPRFHDTNGFDFALKPDITAPGQGIIAALASGVTPESPVDKYYQKLTGTSMSAPMVAGAAAVLAQQHPTYTPAQLKAALMASAKPTSGLSVFGQGAGRLDIGRAVTQGVVADQGSLSLGFFAWPNTGAAPVTRSVVYRNDRTSAVTLTLSTTMTDAGTAVPSGVLAVDHTTLTVPAKGTATAKVTLDVAKGPFGFYEGRLNAASADGSVRLTTALGAYREPESYTLTVSALDSAGKAGSADVQVQNTKTGATSFLSIDGASQDVRLRAGPYVVTAITSEPDRYTSPPNRATVEARSLTVDHNQSLKLDARPGKPVTVTSSTDADTRPFGDTWTTIAHRHSGTDDSGTTVVAPLSTLRVVPTSATISGLSLSVGVELVKAGTSGAGQPPSPYAYHGMFTANDRLADPVRFQFTPANSATVHNHFVAPDGKPTRWFQALEDPDNGGFTGTELPLGTLTDRLDHFTADPAQPWLKQMYQGTPDADGTVDPSEGLLVRGARAYTPEQALTDTWDAGVFGPALTGGAAVRDGDDLSFTLPVRSDGAGHLGLATGPSDSGTVTLLRNGSSVGDGDLSFYDAPVAAGDAGFELRVHAVRSASWTALSTTVDARWTFRSTTTRTATALPLSVVRFSPVLSEQDTAPRTGKFTIPVQVQRMPGASSTTVATLTVDISYDDGKTWTAATVTGSGTAWTATVTHPGKAGFASLRTKETNADGTTVRETIIRAYALR